MISNDDILDILIIGGGINGAGLARDASGRNLKVALFEMNDFASGTSSNSSKLIHGGLRYLEQYKFLFVRESLKEREILKKIAPDIVEPIRFCIPQKQPTRQNWLIRIGLFIYDHLYLGNSLEKSHTCQLKNHPDLISSIHQGFEFSDCRVDDSRLVIMNILDAEKRGAEVNNYCKVTDIKYANNLWTVTIYDAFNHNSFTRKSKTIVNATGPWLEKNEARWFNHPSNHNIKLVKGSHIIIQSPLKARKNYLLQNSDGRIVFVISYLDNLLLIGTTEEEISDMQEEGVHISEIEKTYLIDSFNAYFTHQIKRSDITHHFSGVRPLFNDKKTLKDTTRDCLLIKNKKHSPPFISIYGGKITSYRKTAEKVIHLLKKELPKTSKAWTHSEKLIQINNDSINSTHYEYVDFSTSNTNIPSETVVTQLLPLLDYLLTKEKAKTLNDIIWRRTKLGYFLTRQQKKDLFTFINKQIKNEHS